MNTSRFRVALAIALATIAPTAHALDPTQFDGFENGCAGPPPGIVAGTGSGIRLRGTVVTPTTAFVGEVFVLGDTIVCAGASCATQAGAATATVVETGGLIYPGLIDSSNLALYAAFDANDWAPSSVYANPSQWTSEARYGALVDAKQYLNGDGASPVDFGCELEKYGELKALFGGTTSLVSYANPSRSCYGSLARTIDQAANDLSGDLVQSVTLFPSGPAADAVCSNFGSGATDAYFVPVSEGTDGAAINQFVSLGTISTTDGCLYAPQTTIVGGTALGAPQFATMAATGMGLAWLPRSDVALYGSTTNAGQARIAGIDVSLGTRWSITGNADLRTEMRFADKQDDLAFGNRLSHFDLVQMATVNAARNLDLAGVVGSIAPGAKADLLVIAGNCAAPWSALVNARPAAVRLVLVGGVALYGDASFAALAPTSPGCESMTACGAPKFACVAENGGTAAEKFGQTMAVITSTLTNALSAYDAQDLSAWNFSPLSPLVGCQ